jgi:photosystem II stability/assembly factor-like uncharacterized protein
MHKIAPLIGLCLLFSCKKEKVSVAVQDLSISIQSNFNKVRFFADKAFIVGGKKFDEALIYTLDGHNHLNKLNLPANITNKELYGLDISAQGDMIAVGYDASVLSSHDSGQNWQFTQNGTWKSFQDVAFSDPQKAYIVCNLGFSYGALAAVNQDGEGSTFLLDERNFAIDDIDFVNSSTGYLCGYGAIMKTVDGGNTWSFTTAKNDYFKSMSWKNEQEGIAVGYAGSILKTTNGGETWESSRNGNDFLKKKIHLLAVEQNGHDTWMACGESGFVCISYDNGDHWIEVNNFSDKDLKGICFKSENECAVVGENGGLYLLKL